MHGLEFLGDFLGFPTVIPTLFCHKVPPWPEALQSVGNMHYPINSVLYKDLLLVETTGGGVKPFLSLRFHYGHLFFIKSWIFLQNPELGSHFEWRVKADRVEAKGVHNSSSEGDLGCKMIALITSLHYVVESSCWVWGACGWQSILVSSDWVWASTSYLQGRVLSLKWGRI